MLTPNQPVHKSHKWNKFDSWSLSLGGLPQCESRKLTNIHFFSCSNHVSALDMAGPITKQLEELEEGINAYDAIQKTTVVLLAPVILLCADNPRHSELLGAKANKFCHVCR